MKRYFRKITHFFLKERYWQSTLQKYFYLIALLSSLIALLGVPSTAEFKNCPKIVHNSFMYNMFYIVLFVWFGKSEAILLSGCGLDSVMRLQSRSWSELQSSKAWLEPGDMLPKWSIHMAVGRKLPFLAKYALHWIGPASLTSFQHGTSLSRRNLAEKGQEGSHNASCDFVSEVTYHHFSHILFTRCQ